MWVGVKSIYVVLGKLKAFENVLNNIGRLISVIHLNVGIKLDIHFPK